MSGDGVERLLAPRTAGALLGVGTLMSTANGAIAGTCTAVLLVASYPWVSPSEIGPVAALAVAGGNLAGALVGAVVAGRVVAWTERVDRPTRRCVFTALLAALAGGATWLSPLPLLAPRELAAIGSALLAAAGAGAALLAPRPLDAAEAGAT